MDHFTLNYLGKVETFAKRVRLLDLIDKEQQKNYICASVNNVTRSLDYEVYYDASINFLDTRDYEAIKIYETSLRYIAAMAIKNLYPNLNVRFSYNISRSIFCQFLNLETRLEPRMVRSIEQEMRRIIAADYPLSRKIVSNAEALKIYRDNNYDDKINILQYRPEKTVHLYECNGYLNYMYEFMVPSTGHIKDFIIRMYPPGFIIQYPRSECDGKIPQFEDAPRFGKTLKQSYNWARKVRADSIASINHYVNKEGIIDFINLCESNHNNMLAELGRKITEDIDSIRLICIAGPSSSGKTTFANRLRCELLSLGLEPIRISIDDYYLPKSEIPVGEDGEPDLESLEALDVDLFNQNMLDLIQGEEVQLPRFDFKLGKRVPGRVLQIREDQIIIIEGIHALNEQLTNLIPKHQKFKIYIAPQAQINIDNHNPISLTELRLLRRIVRDKKFRNASAEETIQMWPSVRKGEFRWIYHCQEDADYVFNSLLSYEVCVMKKYALPVLQKIDKDSPYYMMASRLIKFLKYFVDMDDSYVPCNSLLREFIGESCFQDV